MKKSIKSFTFWFALVGIIGVILNVTGFDDVGLFIGFNPILNVLSGFFNFKGDHWSPLKLLLAFRVAQEFDLTF